MVGVVDGEEGAGAGGEGKGGAGTVGDGCHVCGGVGRGDKGGDEGTWAGCACEFWVAVELEFDEGGEEGKGKGDGADEVVVGEVELAEVEEGVCLVRVDVERAREGVV